MRHSSYHIFNLLKYIETQNLFPIFLFKTQLATPILTEVQLAMKRPGLQSHLVELTTKPSKFTKNIGCKKWIGTKTPNFRKIIFFRIFVPTFQNFCKVCFFCSIWMNKLRGIQIINMFHESNFPFHSGSHSFTCGFSSSGVKVTSNGDTWIC